VPDLPCKPRQLSACQKQGKPPQGKHPFRKCGVKVDHHTASQSLDPSPCSSLVLRLLPSAPLDRLPLSTLRPRSSSVTTVPPPPVCFVVRIPIELAKSARLGKLKLQTPPHSDTPDSPDALPGAPARYQHQTTWSAHSQAPRRYAALPP
jgi:hypothetical protein